MERTWGNQRGKKTMLSLTLDSYCGGTSLARNREEAFLNILECILLQIIIQKNLFNSASAKQLELEQQEQSRL